MEKLELLEKIIFYNFQNKSLLDLAMTHPSYANEKKSFKDNQRLEFLGDSVLGLIISEYLFKKFPDKNEGQLSKLKSVLVSKKVLANLAKKIKLSKFIKLGIGEANSGGYNRDSNLADFFEALIGAIFIDGGILDYKDHLINLFSEELNDVEKNGKHKNYKSSLQEISQEKFGLIPKYEVISEKGPEHDKLFLIKVSINDKFSAEGVGKSKKEAEQVAAEKIFYIIKKSNT